MKVGVASKIAAEITKDLSTDVRKKLVDGGFDVGDVARVTCKARVALHLTLDNEPRDASFEIDPKPSSDDSGPYLKVNSELTTWSWSVIPQQAGNAMASISVLTQQSADDGPEEATVATNPKPVRFAVEPNPLYSFSHWTQTNSPTLLAGLWIPFLFWIVSRLWSWIGQLKKGNQERPVGFPAP